MSAPALALSLAVPLLVGCGALRLLGVRRDFDPIAYWGWAYLAGALLSALLVFAWCWSGAPLSGLAMALPLVLAGGSAFLCPPAEPLASPPRAPARSWERALFVLALVLCSLLVLQRILVQDQMAIVNDDEANLWALKAKKIWLAGGFGPAFTAATAHPALLHADYPNLNPLLQVWSFALAGEIVHVANRVPIQAFGIALVLVLGGALRRAARPAVAAALLFLTVTAGALRQPMMLAQADLMVGLGTLAAFDLWLRWRATGRAAFFRFAAVALGFLVWSKNEGLFYAAATAAAFLALHLAGRVAERRRRARERSALPVRAPVPEPQRSLHGRPSSLAERAWLLVPLALVLTTFAFNRAFGFGNDLLGGGDGSGVPFWVRAADRFELNAAPAARHLAATLLDPDHGNWLPPLVLALALLDLRRTFGLALAAPALALALALAGLLLVYVGTPKGSLEWHLMTSASRVLSQLVPAAALWLAVFLGALGRELAREAA